MFLYFDELQQVGNGIKTPNFGNPFGMEGTSLLELGIYRFYRVYLDYLLKFHV